jgi:putative FmdB family regulatory protein
MPLYEYRCARCGQLTEALQRMSEAPLSECPHCGGALERIASAPALHFKGSGWYVNDYGRGRGNDSAGKAESGSTDKAESSSPDKPERGSTDKPERSSTDKPESKTADRPAKSNIPAKAS